ncbi:hypothetical protein V5799_013135 [Amblyomma americanum]|uniref:Cleavage and polyadenylation specificity factor subunit 4 n=1 Tax=Amblyomma americanum TaxID=6943 RepID=A0AAQ4E6U2_AMBAM
MPECYFYSRFNSCSNKQCPFLHIDPDAKVKDCPWYDRGFCRLGPNCRYRHTRRVMCVNYLSGFCPNGPHCKFVHPKFDLPVQGPGPNPNVICHFCGEAGHKAAFCYKMPVESREGQHHSPSQIYSGMERRDYDDGGAGTHTGGGQRGFRPLDQVTCFKCGEKGHYANKCPKGHLAFLSSALNNIPCI